MKLLFRRRHVIVAGLCGLLLVSCGGQHRPQLDEMKVIIERMPPGPSHPSATIAEREDGFLRIKGLAQELLDDDVMELNGVKLLELRSAAQLVADYENEWRCRDEGWRDCSERGSSDEYIACRALVEMDVYRLRKEHPNLVRSLADQAPKCPAFSRS